MKTPILRADPNRPRIEGTIDETNCRDSLQTKITEKNPKVLLIVPPQTRLQKPLKLVLDSIRQQVADTIYSIEEYEKLVNTLNVAGITHIQEQKRAGVPMGLLRIGTAAEKGGYEVKILDATYEGRNQEGVHFQTQEGSSVLRYGLSDAEIVKKIEEYRPDVVGVTSNYTHQRGNAQHMTDLVKSCNENIVVVLGGTHVSSMPEDTLKTSQADFVVRGQADKSFVSLLGAVTKKDGDIADVCGLSYRAQGKVCSTPDTKFMKNIENIAIPDLELINLGLYSSQYHSAGKRKLKDGTMIHGFTSIGCNARCTFCTIPKMQGPWKNMSEAKLDEYLKYIKSFGVTELLIEDDNLLTDPEWTLTVCKKLKEHDLARVEEGGVSLYNLVALLEETSEEEVQGANIDKKVIAAKRKGITAETIIKAMAESGCYSVYLAVETPNKESLTTSKKSVLNADAESTKRIIQLFKKHNIKVTCGLMYGFINQCEDGTTYVESKEQIRKTFERAKELKDIGADYLNFFNVTPLPGSKNFEELGDMVPSNTDEAYTHEFGNISAPNNERTKDELTLLRLKGIIDTIGIDGYIEMQKSGTRPI